MSRAKGTQTRMSVRELCDSFWAWRMREYPELATAFGCHENDHLWDDMSEEAVLRRKEYCEDLLLQLRDAIKSSSKADEQLGLLLIDEVETFVSGLRHKCYVYPVNVMEGPLIDHARTISWMKLDSAEDYEKVLGRLNTVPKSLEHIQSLLRIGMAEGRLPSVVSTEGIMEQFRTLLGEAVEDNGFYKPFTKFPSSIVATSQETLRSRARLAIAEQVYPAYRQLATFFEKEYIPAARHDTIGCIALPDGKQLYQDLLAFHTTTSLTAQEIHDIGLKEVERIRGDMEQVLSEVSFSGSLREFAQHVKADPQFHYKSKEELLAAYRQMSAQIHEMLPKIFKTVRDVPCELVETPPQFAANGPAAYYLAPPPDNSRPGTFYINTFDFENRPTYELVALCLHEGEPGHHFQAVFAMQQTDMPGFRRQVEDRLYYQAPGRFALHTAYMEGWGLYCESLGHDLGLYTDPYMRFGRYSLEILRACRLVVDTGMHVLGWSRQQAIDYLTENTAMSGHNIVTEIDRFITWPGQACAYKIGELEIQELRKEAQSTLGDKFDIREFHEVFLECGAVPMKFFRSAIKEFIATRQ